VITITVRVTHTPPIVSSYAAGSPGRIAAQALNNIKNSIARLLP
jgi:hypothetical protein